MLLFKNDNVPKKTRVQINLFLVASYCSRFVFISTIMVLFFQKFGLSFMQIMLISTIEGIVDFVFEIPSGILADIWGKKKTVLAGIVLNLLGLTMFIVRPGIAMFIIAEVFIDIGATLESGARSALIFGKFESHNMKSEYKPFIIGASKITPLITAVSALTSSFFFSVNAFLPFVLTIFFTLASLIMLAFFKEDSNKMPKPAVITKSHTRTSRKSFRTVKKTLLGSLALFIKNKKLLILTLSSSTLLVLYSNVAYLSQAYLVELMFLVGFIGIFYFALNIISSFSAKFTNKFFANFELRKYYLSVLFMGIATAFLSMKNMYAAIPIYLLICFIFGFTNLTISSEIPLHTDESNRATTLSIVAFFQGLFSIVFEPVIGIIIDRSSISIMYLCVGLFVSVLAFIFMLYSIISKRKAK